MSGAFTRRGFLNTPFRLARPCYIPASIWDKPREESAAGRFEQIARVHFGWFILSLGVQHVSGEGPLLRRQFHLAWKTWFRM